MSAEARSAEAAGGIGYGSWGDRASCFELFVRFFMEILRQDRL